jgi:predicted ABC-type ATPase
MQSDASEGARPCIYVVAGTNGAGKSTVIGAAIVESGAEYFNPDDIARRLRAADQSLGQQEANTEAWNQGRQHLEHAIESRLTYAFETTLGGKTITALLARALAAGIDVKMWYVALATADLHIARVQARVSKGGHDIPRETIRARYDRSRQNLVRLLPVLTELRVFDNSAEGDPLAGQTPVPHLVLHTACGKILAMCQPSAVPEWAKPVVAAALRSSAEAP